MRKTKKVARMARAARTRKTIRRLGADRLTVYRSAQHIYAQIIRHGDATVAHSADTVLVAASTLDKDVRGQLSGTGNKAAAAEVGRVLAKKAMVLGIKQVAFDRSGYQYHGRVAALADAAREEGLEF